MDLYDTRIINDRPKLKKIKIIHTLIWIFFNVVISYMLYAVISNKLDIWLWICYFIILMEIITLFYFRFSCPLTLIARKYSNSKKANFDIYLPNWLAKYNRLIYGCVILAVMVMTIIRLINK